MKEYSGGTNGKKRIKRTYFQIIIPKGFFSGGRDEGAGSSLY